MIECAERGNGGGGDSKRIDFNFSTSTSRSALNESETKLNEEDIAGWFLRKSRTNTHTPLTARDLIE